MPCTECGILFEMKPYLAHKETKYGRFCSMKCRSKFIVRLNPASQKRQIKVQCANCEKRFEIQPYRKLKRNFCSRSCSASFNLHLKWKTYKANHWVNVNCNNCGKKLTLPTWKVRKDRDQIQHFCNRKCFGEWKSKNWKLENNPSWKGGWTPHGSGWRLLTQQIRKEQKYVCAGCGFSEKEIGKALDIHHKIPARLFKTKKQAASRKNLIGLCHKCHMKREQRDKMRLPLVV